MYKSMWMDRTDARVGKFLEDENFLKYGARTNAIIVWQYPIEMAALGFVSFYMYSAPN